MKPLITFSVSGQEIELLVLDEKLFNLLRADLYLCQEMDETDFAINLMKLFFHIFVCIESGR